MNSSSPSHHIYEDQRQRSVIVGEPSGPEYPALYDSIPRLPQLDFFSPVHQNIYTLYYGHSF